MIRSKLMKFTTAICIYMVVFANGNTVLANYGIREGQVSSNVSRKSVVSNNRANEVVRTKIDESMLMMRSLRNQAEDTESTEEQQGIRIDKDIFNSTSVRLNTEIYNDTAAILTEEHIIRDYGIPTTKLYRSYLDNVDPLVPMALSLCETGMWADSRYTWCSAVYSKLLVNKGVNMSRLKVSQVNVDTYIVNGLCTYLGCGSNCTAPSGSHYHTIGNNDNDSLGPLQILRHYVEAEGAIKYPCGEATVDLMCWSDNVEYFLHKQSSIFSDKNNWNRNHEIASVYELVALMGVAHNTGGAFLSCESGSSDAGSLWKNAQAVYDYCSVLGSKEAFDIMSEYIDEWYESAVQAESEGRSFAMAGSALTGKFDEMLRRMGVEKNEYSNGWQHKQYYPLKAVLDYMALERLYYSGEEEASV